MNQMQDRDRSQSVEAKRWQTFMERDSRHDGAFVVAVKTTGIYCRPSCPSRRPKRQNVMFFDLPEAAVFAGYRACKRCRPDEVAANDPTVSLVRQACSHIDEALEGEEATPPSLGQLAQRAGQSPHHFQRVFKRLMGISPKDYADARRLRRFKRGLKGGDGVADALYDAGYGSSSRVYERAAGQLGMTPATYARGGKGAHIGYTLADSSLGRLLVAATESGVCMVSLGDDDAYLEAELRRDFPEAEIERDTLVLETWVSALIDCIGGEEPHPDLPLDVRGTAFQRRVWRELMAIPGGDTLTYGEIAQRIGKPKAARAVGRACATNPVSLIIPCHRALGANGSLTGYRWGKQRKQALLENEKAASERQQGTNRTTRASA